jgi:hypothetical protein
VNPLQATPPTRWIFVQTKRSKKHTGSTPAARTGGKCPWTSHTTVNATSQQRLGPGGKCPFYKPHTPATLCAILEFLNITKVATAAPTLCHFVDFLVKLTEKKLRTRRFAWEATTLCLFCPLSLDAKLSFDASLDGCSSHRHRREFTLPRSSFSPEDKNKGPARLQVAPTTIDLRICRFYVYPSGTHTVFFVSSPLVRPHRGADLHEFFFQFSVSE